MQHWWHGPAQPCPRPCQRWLKRWHTCSPCSPSCWRLPNPLMCATCCGQSPRLMWLRHHHCCRPSRCAICGNALQRSVSVRRAMHERSRTVGIAGDCGEYWICSHCSALPDCLRAYSQHSALPETCLPGVEGCLMRRLASETWRASCCHVSGAPFYGPTVNYAATLGSNSPTACSRRLPPALTSMSLWCALLLRCLEPSLWMLL